MMQNTMALALDRSFEKKMSLMKQVIIFFFDSIFNQGIQFSRASLNGVLNTTQNKDN